MTYSKWLQILLMIATAYGRPQYDYGVPSIQPSLIQFRTDDSQKDTLQNPLGGGNIYGLTSSSGGDISTSIYTGASNQGFGLDTTRGGGSSTSSFTGSANNQGFGVDFTSGGGSSTTSFTGSANNQGLGIDFTSGGVISTDRFGGRIPTINNLGISTGGATSSTKFSGVSTGGVKYAQPIIEKHVYVHVAPEDQDESREINITPPPPRVHYKIIFIKAPSAKIKANIVQQQHQEEKTFVYVLVKKPEINVKSEVIETPKSKPEVYFIKYQTKGDKAQDDGSLLLSTNLSQQKPSIVTSGGSSSSGSKFNNVSNVQQLGTISSISGGSSSTSGINLNASGSGTSNTLGFQEYGPPKSG